MSVDYALKTIPAERLVGLTATLAPDQLSDHIEPMFNAVGRALMAVGGPLTTPIATYAWAEDGMNVVVGYAWDGPPPAGTEVIELPTASAVCGVHLGPMSGIRESWHQLHRWAIDNRYSFTGPSREVYVKAEAEDQGDWVTELQQPVAPNDVSAG